ncbi:MAG: hypothetical protein RSE38_00805 [Acinetobacter sp.]
MTNQEIKDRAPDGATHYKVMNSGSVLYFNGSRGIEYWNEVKSIFEKTVNFYFESEIKPL